MGRRVVPNDGNWAGRSRKVEEIYRLNFYHHGNGPATDTGHRKVLAAKNRNRRSASSRPGRWSHCGASGNPALISAGHVAVKAASEFNRGRSFRKLGREGTEVGLGGACPVIWD